MKQKIILLVALLAGIAAFILSKQNFESFKIKFQSQFATVRVVVAARSLPPGTVLRAGPSGDLGTKTVFQKQVIGRAIKPDEYTEIVGRKTRTSLLEGDPILWSDIDMPYGGLGGLSGMIQVGERAISVPVDNTANVSGLVKPNDHVDILGTFTFPTGVRGAAPAGAPAVSGIPDTVTLTILQDVTVLACGRNMSRRTMEGEMPERYGGDQYSAVTVAVTPREAEMLVFAHSKGRLSLALRNREDVSMPPLTESVDFQKLEKNFGLLNSQRQQRLHPVSSMLSAPAPAPAAQPAPAAPPPLPSGTRP